MTRLLTRRQIINEWQRQPEDKLDSVCCPVCRDLLHEQADRYFCLNENCSQGFILKSEVLK